MQVEYLGEYETDLYDLSVQDNNNFFGNDILVHNCDTDSIYVNLEPLIVAVFGTSDISRSKGESFIDKVCKEKIEGVIEEGYKELAIIMGAYRNAMKMKREKITDRSLFVAKKRYIMNTLNSEGVHYAEPKVSVTGIEAVRSSTPEVCRDKMKKLFKIMLTGTEEETQKFIGDFKAEFKTLPVEDIAKISGTNDIEKYLDDVTLYRKGCPIHIRGCILHNYYIEGMELQNIRDIIRSGDKIKFVYLKTPNPIRENVISFLDRIPPELGLEKYIDYNTQFEKVFLKPMRDIMNCIGWNDKPINNLKGFFE